MELLTAINTVLPKLGERPVTSLAAKHPTLAILLPIVERKRREALLKGWWFNSYKYTASPDPAGKIVLGVDTLSFVPEYADTAILRGNRLFNPVTLTEVFSAPVRGTIVQDVAFDELPESAAQFVLHSALVDAYVTDIGMTQEVQVWQTVMASSWSDLLAEHLRQRRPNTKQLPAWAKLKRAMRA